MNDWKYNGKVFDSEDIPEKAIGFVYLITDTANGKMYVGKKLFYSTRRLPPLKGMKRKRTKVTESDWKKYHGSSEQVKLLVEERGEDFEREILHICFGKGDLSYMELLEQIERKVLFDDAYYNEFIGVKIHSKHVKSLQDRFMDKQN